MRAGTPATNRRRTVLGLLALALVVTGGCTRALRAERDGKDVGEALCDLRGATADTAREALSALQDELDDLAGKYAAFTAEDRADVRENLADLAEHVASGDELLVQQDLTVIERSLDNLRDDVDDTAQAALDGISEGLGECING